MATRGTDRSVLTLPGRSALSDFSVSSASTLTTFKSALPALESMASAQFIHLICTGPRIWSGDEHAQSNRVARLPENRTNREINHREVSPTDGGTETRHHFSVVKQSH